MEITEHTTQSDIQKLRPIRLLAFTAHPDDEILLCATSFLHLKHCYGSQVETIIACATRGENRVRPGFSPTVRPGELHQAADALHVDRVHFLGFQNGAMIQMLGPINGRIVQNEREIPINSAWFNGLKPGHRWEDHVAAVRILSALAFSYPPDMENYDWQYGHLANLVETIVRLIRVEKPDVIVAMEPFGNYGHNEHIMIHHAATASFYLSGQADVWPEHLDEGLVPHAPSKLYWGGLYKRMIYQSKNLQDGTMIDEARLEMGIPKYHASLHVEYPEVAEQVHTAMSAYRSQFELSPWVSQGEPERHFFASDYFLRVHPPIQEGELAETSLVDGFTL